MSRLRKIFVAIFIIFLICTLFSNISNAAERDGNKPMNWGRNPAGLYPDKVIVGDKVTLTRDWAWSHGDMCCIWRNQSFGNERTYKAVSRITIVGDKATDSYGKTVENKANRNLAYILDAHNGKATGSSSKVQNEIWYYVGTWINRIGYQFDGLYKGFTNRPGVYGRYSQKANNYAEDLEDDKLENQTNSKSVTVESYVKDGNTALKIGPFKFTFRGKLNVLEVSDGDGKTFVKPIAYGVYDGSKFKEVKLNEIKSGDKFYIIIPADCGINEIGRIKVKETYKVISADIAFWECKGNNEKSVSWQNIIHFKTSNANESSEANWKIEIIPLVIDLSGLVWEDNGKIVKSNVTYNSVIDQNETRVSGIGVRLVDKDGNIIKNLHNQEARTTTDSKGEYKFSDIKISDVKNGCIVEFEYNGITYTSVKPLIGNDNKINSKSSEVVTQRKALNAGFTEITNHGDTESRDKGYSRDANGNPTGEITYKNNTQEFKSTFESTTYDSKTYSGTNLTANTKVAGFDIAKQYAEGKYEKNSQGKNEIKYINLGLVRRDMPIMGLTNDITSAYVIVNGYNHEYKYGIKSDEITEAAKKSDFNLGVKFKNELKQEYRRAVYPSDVKHSEQPTTSEDNKLKVYIKYCTTINNLSNVLSMSANEYVTYYDKRYDLVVDQPDNVVYNCTSYYVDSTGKEVPITWNNSSKYTQTAHDSQFKAMYTTSLKDAKINGLDSIKVYFTFRVNDATVLDLLNNKASLDCVSEVFSYSTYYGTDAEGCKTGDIYAGIDQESAPGNAKMVVNDNKEMDKTTFETDTDNAPSLLLEAIGARDLEGTVFEDKTEVKDNERQGDGIYKNEENTASNVKVELFDINDPANKDANGNIKLTKVATVYPPQSGQMTTAASEVNSVREGVSAIAFTHDDNKNLKENNDGYTGKDGYYIFRGIEPGKYIIKYTYGDGKTKLYDTNGNVIQEQDPSDPTKMIDLIVNVQNYKSTLIKSDNVKKAFEDNNNNLEWYKNDTDRFSDARDNYEVREAIDDEIMDVTTNTNPTIKTLDAETPKFEIGVEYDSIITAAMTDKDRFCVLIKDVDFGIAERPRQLAKLQKKIKYITVKNDLGQTLIDGEVDIEKGIAPKNNGLTIVGGNLLLTMESEMLQDSQIELKYDLIFTNASEKDYRYDRYYYYGEKDESKIVKHNGTTLLDYVDSEMVLSVNQTEAEGGKWKVIDLAKEGENPEYMKLIRSKDAADQERLRKILESQYSAIVASDKLDFTNPLVPGGSTSAEIVVEKLLTSKDKELSFENNGEIVRVQKSGGSNIGAQLGSYAALLAENPDAQPMEMDEAKSELTTIIPPTGLTNHNMTYAIISIICLAILGAGTYGVRRFLAKK